MDEADFRHRVMTTARILAWPFVAVAYAVGMVFGALFRGATGQKMLPGD